MKKKQLNNQHIVLLVICIVQFLNPFMSSGVNIALPAIGNYYQATTFQLSLTSMLYLLGIGCMLLPSGQLADLYGRKKIYFLGLTVSILATLCITFSPNITLFLLFRGIQGMATALITTSSFAILSSVIPPERRGRSLGLVIACTYAGLSTGPALGGFFVDMIHWKAIFWFTAILTVLSLTLGIISLRGEWWGERNQQFDYTGSIIFTLTLTCLTVGITGKEWIGDWSFAMLLAAALGFIVFIVFEQRITSPIFPVKYIQANASFSLSVLASLLNYASSFGIIFFFSLYLQSVKGLSSRHAGSLLMIQALVQCVISPGAGKLADRIYPGKIASFGMGLCAISLLLASQIDASSPMTLIMTIFVIMGIGFALFSSPNTTLIMNSVPKTRYGMASSLTAIARTQGMLISMGISTFLIEYFMGHTVITAGTHAAFMSTMHWAMVIFSGICFVGIFCSIGGTRKKYSK